MAMYDQQPDNGIGSNDAAGMAITVVAKLMAVTDHNRSSLLRSKAFHIACSAAADSVSARTVVRISTPASGESRRRARKWCAADIHRTLVRVYLPYQVQASPTGQKQPLRAPQQFSPKRDAPRRRHDNSDDQTGFDDFTKDDD